jgi:NAD(P)-dependent dehydrogenase (short-subunit alcohol dehydrogenase family)
VPRLTGQIAFVTGAGSGIGRASARLFAREGAAVAVVDIDDGRGRAAAEEIRRDGGSAAFVETDVTDEAAVAAAAARVVSELGDPTVLFNCAGGSVVEDGSVTDVDMRVWDRTINLDVKGTFLCCRHVIPRMIAAGGGSVVNMSSGAALRGASPAHVYTTAKGAILSLTRALAGRYARDNIRANAICSGRVWTDRITETYGRLGEAGHVRDPQDSESRAVEYPFWVGEPEDIAHVALFLASNEARMITGAAIQADGGRSSY